MKADFQSVSSCFKYLTLSNLKAKPRVGGGHRETILVVQEVSGYHSKRRFEHTTVGPTVEVRSQCSFVRGVKVPSGSTSHRPEIKCNCVIMRWGGKQQEVNDQSVREELDSA